MWIYGNIEIKSLEDVPNGSIGFVYMLTHRETGLRYIGKKNLYRANSKESDWLKYLSSSSSVKALSKDLGDFERVILEFFDTKIDGTYLECQHLFEHKVLTDNRDLYLNRNILGKFYKGRVKKYDQS